MKQFTRGLLLILSLAVITTQISYAKVEKLDGIVASVDNQIILRSDLDNQVNLVKQQILRSNNQLPPMATLRKQVLNHLIDVQLQMEVAKKQGITVTPDMLNKAVSNIAKQNNLSLAELRKKVVDGGLPYAQYRKNIREQIILSRLQHEVVGSDVKVTRAQLDEFVDQYHRNSKNPSRYHLKHILIATPEAPTPKQIAAAKAKANAVLAELKKGTNFSKVAIEKSDGQTALKGGELGWMTLAQMPSVFTKYVVKMKVQQVSPLIHTPNGYHIIKVVGRQLDRNQQLTREQLKRILYQRQFAQKVQDWVQKLKTKAYIKTYL